MAVMSITTCLSARNGAHTDESEPLLLPRRRIRGKGDPMAPNNYNKSPELAKTRAELSRRLLLSSNRLPDGADRAR